MAVPSAPSRTPSPRSPLPEQPDDVVMARALAFAEWARRNARAIIIGASVLAVLVLGFVYWRYLEADRASRAAVAYNEVQAVMAGGDEAQSRQALEEFVAAHDGTAEADEARIALAELHLKAGRPAEAVETLGGVEDGSVVAFPARMLRGAAQGAAGETGAAVETYLAAADAAELEYQRVEALNEAALLREQAGQYGEAAEIYERLAESLEEGSNERAIFEMRGAEARARADAR